MPPIFPDNDIVRGDILDYLVEVEHFDEMVARAIESLEAANQLDNTIVVVTSDHGMPFPRAKASLYDAGSRVPLAIRWPKGIASAGREVETFVNLSDLAPTFLEAVGLTKPEMMTARSLMNLFQGKEFDDQKAAYIAMERHDGCRQGGKGYPCRAIRTQDYLYIHNFEPSRWPSGSPDAAVCARSIPYGEIDSSPTKSFMMEHRNQHARRLFVEEAGGACSDGARARRRGIRGRGGQLDRHLLCERAPQQERCRPLRCRRLRRRRRGRRQVGG